MTFDARQAGFAWPEEMQLTNVSGETMTIRPHAANLSSVQEAGKLRVGQCYRYYTSDRGLLNELEVFYWYAGGQQVVLNFLSEFKRIFDDSGSSRLALEQVLESLQTAGFDETTVRVCLRWLVQDGYVAVEDSKGVQFLDLIKW